MKRYARYIGSIFFYTLFLLSTAHAAFMIQVNNNSYQTINITYNGSNLSTINPGTSWTSGYIGGQINFNIPNYGMLALFDIGTDHIEGDDPSLYYGVLISYQDMDVVGRYPQGYGGLLISIGKYGDVELSGDSFSDSMVGMTLNDVVINRLTHN